MRIKSLTLEKVRGFSSLKLDFWDAALGEVRPRTAIVGSNGSGKTTILEAIFELLASMNLARSLLFAQGDASAELVVVDLPSSANRPLHIKVAPNAPEVKIAYPATKDELGEQRLISSSGQIRMYGEAGYLPQLIETAKQGKGDFPNSLYFPSEGRRLHPKSNGQVMDEPEVYDWVYRFSDSEKWQGSLESLLVATYLNPYNYPKHGVLGCCQS